MQTTQSNRKKNILNAAKVFIASLSITSLFGLWNLFSKEADSSAAAAPDLDQNQQENILNSPLPTLVPSVLDDNPVDGSTQQLVEVSQQAAQPTQEPVIERVVIGSSGGSGGGSPAASTSSSS